MKGERQFLCLEKNMINYNMLNEAITTTLFVAIGIPLFIAIAVFILKGIGLYSIAHRRGLSHPWLAWIPIGNSFTIGKIADSYKEQTSGKRSSLRWAILILNIVTLICFAIEMAQIVDIVRLAIIGSDLTNILLYQKSVTYLILLVVSLLTGIATIVFMFVALHSLYKSCSNKHIVMLVFSILVPITLPIFVFAIRRNDCLSEHDA